MKNLIIYCSYTGETKKLAEILSKKINNVDVIGVVFGIPRAILHILGIRIGNYPSIEDISKYNFIYCGCPVWAGGPAPSFKKLIKNLNISDRKLRCFFRAGNNKADNIQSKIKKIENKMNIKIEKYIVINGNDSNDIINRKFEELIK